MSRLSRQEVGEIARLASERRAVVYGNGPTVHGLADELGLPPHRIEELLSEIRDRRAGLIGPDRGPLVRRSAIGAAILLSLVLLGLGIKGGIDAFSTGPSSRRMEGRGPTYGARLSAGLPWPGPSQEAPARSIVGYSEGPPPSGVSKGTLLVSGEDAKTAEVDLNRAIEKSRPIALGRTDPDGPSGPSPLLAQPSTSIER